MKLGIINKKFLLTILFFFEFSYLVAEEKIQFVPLINLEELSPTFEEDKDELEKNDDLNIDLNTSTTFSTVKAPLDSFRFNGVTTVIKTCSIPVSA